MSIADPVLDAPATTPVLPPPRKGSTSPQTENQTENQTEKTSDRRQRPEKTRGRRSGDEHGKAQPAAAASQPVPSHFDWPVAFWLVVVHGGALAAPFFFSWQGLLAAVVLHWVTGGLGVCLCYHRLLTHTGFSTWRGMRWFLSVLGGLSGEGPALDWVANHRKHHALSDQPGDPHSPHDGPWWSHMLWMAWSFQGKEHEAHMNRWAPDIARDRGLRLIGALFLPLHFAAALALGAFGYWLGGWTMGASMVAWGVFVRLVLVFHSTWLVNSASHMWGYRNYKTTDDSRNNWWVALITYGEGWHNNHHAYPRMAKHGHRWWEYDPTFLTIRLMQKLGLAWDVVDYKRKKDRHQQR